MSKPAIGSAQERLGDNARQPASVSACHASKPPHATIHEVRAVRRNQARIPSHEVSMNPAERDFRPARMLAFARFERHMMSQLVRASGIVEP